MDFAKNLMKKYGWAEGQGLGKNNHGMVKPLKANLKFDNSGFGLDKATEFNNHWWERVFNEAAGNINIKKDKEDISFAIDDNEAVEISTKDYSVTKLKKLKGNEKHENFIKSSILKGATNVEEIPNKIETDSLKFNTKQKALTDDELFMACGGRTAHKGARHGINMKGKLARIEEQEKELLNRMKKAKVMEETDGNNKDWRLVSNKKKRKSKMDSNDDNDYIMITLSVENEKKMKLQNEISNDNNDDGDEIKNLLYTAEYSLNSKNKRKKEKKVENELIKSLSATRVTEDESKHDTKFEDSNEQGQEVSVKRKKKQQKNYNRICKIENPSNIENSLIEEDEETKTKRKKKKKKKKITIEGESSLFNEEQVNFDNDARVENAIENNRTDDIYMIKNNRNDKAQSNIYGIDSKSNAITSKSEKRKMKKSIKKINKQIEKSLSIA